MAARWVEPERRDGPLVAYARDAAAKTLELLEETLNGDDARQPATALLS